MQRGELRVLGHQNALLLRCILQVGEDTEAGVL